MLNFELLLEGADLCDLCADSGKKKHQKYFVIDALLI